MGPLGWQETIVIFVLALLVFGPKKLPELGKTIGKAMTEFRRASAELKHTWDREMSALEREQESLKETTRKYESEITQSIDDGSQHSYDNQAYDYDSGYNYAGESEHSTTSDSSTTVGATETEGAEQTAVNTAANGNHAAPAGVAEAPPPSVETPNGSVSEPVRS